MPNKTGTSRAARLREVRARGGIIMDVTLSKEQLVKVNILQAIYGSRSPTETVRKILDGALNLVEEKGIEDAH